MNNCKWRRIIVLLFGLTVTAALAASSPEKVKLRVGITSQPEGATILVDGVERGQTPLVIYDLVPGVHHLKYRRVGYVDCDQFVDTSVGLHFNQHADLKEELGLLLVKTDPPGCNIRVDGLSVGESPRFISNLAVKDVHSIRLSKAGYQDQTISVKFNGREVLVRDEKLILDSGTITLETDPPGAEAMVNGIVRGMTPLTVSGVPKGTATVKLRKAGYREEMREVRMNAGEEQTLSVSLAGIPGSLHLLSSPSGASFYLDGDARGKGPLSISGLAPRDYQVRCELDGYAPVVRTVTIGRGAVVREEFRLENIRGRVEVKTSPAGAEVWLDGKRAGVTKASSDEGIETSDVLSIENVNEGEHTLLVRKDGYRETSGTICVEARKTAHPRVITLKRAFIPNVEVTTFNEVIRGVYKSRSETSIIIERSPGVDYPIPLSAVRKTEFITK